MDHYLDHGECDVCGKMRSIMVFEGRNEDVQLCIECLTAAQNTLMAQLAEDRINGEAQG